MSNPLPPTSSVFLSATHSNVPSRSHTLNWLYAPIQLQFFLSANHQSNDGSSLTSKTVHDCFTHGSNESVVQGPQLQVGPGCPHRTSEGYLHQNEGTRIMASQAGFQTDFEQQVENMIQRDTQMKCPKFSSLLHLLEICSPSNTPSAFLLQHSSPDDNFDVNVFLADMDQPEWADALDFNVLTAHKCWTPGDNSWHFTVKFHCVYAPRGLVQKI
ncbi:uncharacterized protein VP01_2724g1 [Puccinia sorghi]|uniref:Uncharacterized protein n=1 Tax=Puccinia sorghi TaxID=27349 RepID=A0A0L6V3E3_9BASI|nr:uncharacterized protein VP01_2724g1 [Puccinia sorghi]